VADHTGRGLQGWIDGRGGVVPPTRGWGCSDEEAPSNRLGTVEGTTDGDGVATLKVPKDASSGTIKVWPYADSPDTFIPWKLRFKARLKPANTPAGASMRLRNLNYYFGHVVDEMTDELVESVRYFQADWEELHINGELDPVTAKKLEELHDLR
jgi:hypothetical protein